MLPVGCSAVAFVPRSADEASIFSLSDPSLTGFDAGSARSATGAEGATALPSMLVVLLMLLPVRAGLQAVSVSWEESFKAGSACCRAVVDRLLRLRVDGHLQPDPQRRAVVAQRPI